MRQLASQIPTQIKARSDHEEQCHLVTININMAPNLTHRRP